MNFVRYLLSFLPRRPTIVEPINTPPNTLPPMTMETKIDLVLNTFTEYKLDELIKLHNYYHPAKRMIPLYACMYDKARLLIEFYEADKKSFVYYDLRFLFEIRRKELPAIKRMQVF
jgi:hypothetical protein